VELDVTANTEESLEAFFIDPRVVELCELLRVSDDLLDVINLSENQHSSMLAWLLDPREGHGQGDQILRDLLIAATTSARSTNILDGRGRTSRFFSAWPPSRIRTATFGSAFVARELGISARERVDLFVIDPQNHFILVIENKAGMNHSGNQLDSYRRKFDEIASSNPSLKDYDCAFIALDRYFQGDDEKEHPSASTWLHIGYDWLQVSANRALMHMERGNNAARLVVSYCNRQTDWDSPHNRRSIELASALHHDHSDAIKRLLSMSIKRIETEWLSSRAPPAELEFMLQNRSLGDLLRETQGMASVASSLLARAPGLTTDSLEHGRVWMDICPTGWEKYFNGDWWPVYLSIIYSNKDRTQFRVSLVWNSHHARSETEAKQLRGLLAEYDPRFSTHSESSRRWIVLDKNLSLQELFHRVPEVFARLKKLLEVRSVNP